MKRKGNLYAQIVSEENISLADDKARKAKHNRYGVRKHDENRELENTLLSGWLERHEYRTSDYTTFKIYEPKERVIFRLPYFPDRIVHHAIMNILEPIWKSVFTRDTYSSISGRGIHALLKKLTSDLAKDPNGTIYCLKLDIHKFYPSIDHEILKRIIRKKLKDKDLLQTLDEIIDSADGVPIGNYLSQYFANIYLAYFDHWVKEVLRVKYYYRYADDIVLLSSSKEQLHNWFKQIREYLDSQLNLQLKPNWQIFSVEERGIDYVGYVIRHKYVLLRKSTKIRMWKTIRRYKAGKISYTKFRSSMASYIGWLKYCNSGHLLQKIYKETGLRDSGWNGSLDRISKFENKWIYVTSIIARKKYYKIQFIYRNKPYEIYSRNILLFWKLVQLHYPCYLKLSNVRSNKNRINNQTRKNRKSK